MFHLGSFNPKFLGVSFQFGGLNFELFRSLLNVEPNDYDYGVNWNEVSDEAIGIPGIINHEQKHYYDALVSKLSNDIFWLKATMHLNGYNALSELGALPGNLVLSPIRNWIEMPLVDRGLLLENLNSNSNEEFLLPDLPYVPASEWDNFVDNYKKFDNSTSEEKAALLGALTTDYNDIIAQLYGNYFEGEITFSVRDIYEASAYANQIIAIKRNVNDDVKKRFCKVLANQDNSPWSMINYILDVWHECNGSISRDFDSDLAHISVITTWAILGNASPTNREGFPDYRIGALVNLWQQGKGLLNGPPYAKVPFLWDMWDMLLGFSSWRMSLEASYNGTMRRISSYSDMVHDGEVVRRILRISTFYGRRQEEVIQHVLQNPDHLCVPREFLNGHLSKTSPVASTLLHLNNVFMKYKSDYEPSERNHMWKKETELGTYYYKKLSLEKPWHGKTLLEDFVSLHEINNMIEYIILGEPLNDQDAEQSIKIFERESGKRVLPI